MTSFQQLFFLGMDRVLPPLLDPPQGGITLALGESGSRNSGADMRLGLPDWRWPQDPIPCPNESVSLIHAYHFLEHLTGDEAIELLMEAQRVLIPGGVLQFSIPWAKSQMAFQDLTHKSFWTEDNFKMLFRNGYYEPGGIGRKWLLDVHFMVIAGIVERNMALIGQLVKRGSND